jgi:hypothetical protein
MMRTYACLLAVTMASSLIMQAADRNWQPGTLISAEQREERGLKQTKQTESSVDDQGTETTKTTTQVQKADTADIYMYYEISNGKTMYLVRQMTNAFFVTGVKAQPGDKIEFAVDGANLYIRRDDGKESKLRVVKTSIAPSQSSPQ